MEKPGPKTKLTEELFKEIRKSILDGNDLRETAKVCEINEGTLYVWHSDNYLNIADKISGWKRDRKLMLAEKNIEEILLMSIRNTGVTKDGKEIYEYDDTGKLRIKADISKFVSETLGKDNYSKREELTGKDGKELISIEKINYIKPNADNFDSHSKTASSL